MPRAILSRDGAVLTAGAFEATLLRRGATVARLLVPDRAGERANVVLDPSRHPPGNYVGPVMGRVARIVAGGRYVLDGVIHDLVRNDGPHHVHGGHDGFDRRDWTVETGTAGDTARARFTLVSPDGNQGHPGTLTATVTYGLSEDGALAVAFRARTTRATMVDLTAHVFFDLTCGQGVAPHRLRIAAARTIAADRAFVPLPGPPLDVGRRLDFRRARMIAGAPIDDCFVLDGAPVAAVLEHRGSGRRLSIRTDQPVLAVTTGDHLEPSRAGICLQPGGYPDAPNRPDFRSIRLDPGAVYRHDSVYRFERCGQTNRSSAISARSL